MEAIYIFKALIATYFWFSGHIVVWVFFLLYIIKQILHENFPDDMELITEDVKSFVTPLIESIVYNAIYYCSFFQIKLTKMYSYFKCNAPIEKRLYYQHIIKINNDGSEGEINAFNVSYANQDSLASIFDLFVKPEHYDKNLIIFSSYNGSGVDRCLLEGGTPWNCKIEKSNIKFISVVVSYADNDYTIMLDDKLSGHNYYIVGNCLTHNFIKYYLKTYLQVKVEQTIKYTLQVIDNNVNIVSLTHNDCLVINKDDYDIVKNRTESFSDNEDPNKFVKIQETDLTV